MAFFRSPDRIFKKPKRKPPAPPVIDNYSNSVVVGDIYGSGYSIKNNAIDDVIDDPSDSADRKFKGGQFSDDPADSKFFPSGYVDVPDYIPPAQGFIPPAIDPSDPSDRKFLPDGYVDEQYDPDFTADPSDYPPGYDPADRKFSAGFDDRDVSATDIGIALDDPADLKFFPSGYTIPQGDLQGPDIPYQANPAVSFSGLGQYDPLVFTPASTVTMPDTRITLSADEVAEEINKINESLVSPDDPEEFAKQDGAAEAYWGVQEWNKVKDAWNDLVTQTPEEQWEAYQYLANSPAMRFYLEMGGKVYDYGPFTPGATGEWLGLGDILAPPTSKEAQEQKIDAGLSEKQIEIRDKYVGAVVMPDAEYITYWVKPGAIPGDEERIIVPDGVSDPALRNAGYEQRREEVDPRDLVDNPYSWIKDDGDGNAIGKFTQSVLDQIQRELKTDENFAQLDAEKQDAILTGEVPPGGDDAGFTQGIFDTDDVPRLGDATGEYGPGRFGRSPDVQGMIDKIVLPPDTDAVDTDAVSEEDKTTTTADPTVDAKVDADTTVAAVEPKGPFGPPGSEETEFVVNPIRRSSYRLPSDPGFETEDASPEQDAAYIIREIAGLREGSKRQNPYTLEALRGDAYFEHKWSDHDWEGNPRGQLDLNPPYLQGKEAEEAGSIYRMVYGGQSAIWEWAVDLLMTQYGYSDQEILDQMNAGWAYYNYSAEELAGAGRGAEVPTSPITDAPQTGTLGNGDNEFGSDGNNPDNIMDWANLAPDFRGEVARGTDKLQLAGEQPSWWVDYLPLEITPNSIHIAAQNAVLPFLSKANQKTLGFHLALGLGGELDQYLDLPGSLHYGEESNDELVWGPGAAARWQNLKQTIENLRRYVKGRLSGTVAASNLMQLDWLYNSVDRLQIMTASGKPGQRRLDSYKDEIHAMFAEAVPTNDREKENWATGYGELLRMILEPYVPYLESAWADIEERGERQEYN
tara:strand:+ start:454 stop:3366 length:2913 start_codon:yes stop_codon:yes gene_type:complete